ncbi:unnamed protein product [Adineta steineri]|uniref:G-protein coupled receptors family 1 profile domain-containing protein n=1 Tax=Adineta steineri TaxID=433720 RepID=A0A814AF58_9BILA|nr:unnamed protein product [Adineta steineri]CAF4018083.1 unnamed protein product [Adineta steineri]
MGDSSEHIRLIKYAVLQTTIVPSILCDLLVFAYVIRYWRREIVNAPQNHAILCLLIVSFIQKTTDLPMSLYLLRWGITFRQTNTFCVIWGWVDYSLLVISLHLISWCSIERHLFVFHGLMMKKRSCLILFHYIPMILCLLYAPLFYLSVIIFPSMCTNVWDYTYMFCGGGCYGSVPFWGTFDWLFNYALWLFIILFANLLLFYRFTRQRLRHQQPIQSRHKIRMIIQLGFISVLYLVFMSPEIILGVIEALWSPTFGIDVEVNYLYYICNFINQFLPFVIVSSLPGIRKELNLWFQRIRRRNDVAIRVHPLMTGTVLHR